MNTILIIIGLLAVAVGVYYFGFYKKGKINDADGNFIPDEIDAKVDKAKATVKEVKRRAKNVKAEIKDVIEEAKDVKRAVKGGSRRGRKPKAKK
tara:strand:- start:323 stop:604 length:282 start_codon:yes stop_codon:yes gene_type:complete